MIHTFFDFYTIFGIVFNSFELLLGVHIFSFFFRSYMLGYLIFRRQRNRTPKKPWILLILVLVSAAISSSAWIFWLFKKIYIPSMSYQHILFWSRIAWGFSAVMYQSLILFVEYSISQSTTLSVRQKIYISISSCFVLFAFALAFFDFHCPDSSNRPAIEFLLRDIESTYLLFCLILPSMILMKWRLHTQPLPRILKRQASALINIVILPMWLCDIIQSYSLASPFSNLINSNFATSLSTLLLTFATYKCARKMAALRFLNFNPHVQSTLQYNFIDGFKSTLEQLSYTTSFHELAHISQVFFKQAFDIPLAKTTLYVRKQASNETKHTVPSLVENFFDTQGHDIEDTMHHARILIYDEIAFNNFYAKNKHQQAFLQLLDTIDADVFLPIYDKQKMLAYIVVERNSRPHMLYGDVERDEMLVYSSYIGNIINLLQHKNLTIVLQQEKELKDALYEKHQEITQYKESMRSFLKHSKQKEIGILFYKNRQFTFANQAAKEMVSVNVNVQDGHPLTKTLKHIAHQVEEYKTPQSRLVRDHEGMSLVLTAVPSIEHSNVIISVYPPEMTDLIKQQINLLKDPTQWDYLLYLQTTQSGKLINQLIPGNGETLLQLKIELLKIALSRKAVLLTMPEEDLLPTVEILHHMSVREILHSLTLTKATRAHNETAIKLFGINPLLKIATATTPLLEQLDGKGTLFIQNIQFLDLESQAYLAEYLKFGVYRMFKSEHKTASDVRIICSTTQDLQSLVHEGLFLKELFEELTKMTLNMPSLLTLPQEELTELADGFAEQALQHSHMKNLLELTDREKSRVVEQAQSLSLHEFKHKIQQLLVQKSKTKNLYNEDYFNPAYQIADPALVDAAHLGKHALKDPQVMALLWNKLKSQSKIASLLRVNRSSVNRRLKDFNLE